MEKNLKIVLIIFIIFFIGIILFIQKDFIIDYFTFNPIIKPTMTGVVVRVNEHSLDVMGINNSSGLYSIGFTEEGNIGFKQGQEVLITYNGFRIDTYPYQLGKVYNIKISKDKSDVKIPKDVLAYYYGTSKVLEDIPTELLEADAIQKGYFVYNCIDNKVYNKSVLDRFVNNTKRYAIPKITDDIVIVVYNMNNEPIIYYLFYDASLNKYTYEYDYTRVISWESPIEESSNPEMHNKIITNNNISGEYYGIEVIENKEFNVAIILLKAHNNEYKDIEIVRYLLDAEIVK